MPEMKTKWTRRDELQLLQLAKMRREIMDPHEKRLRAFVQSLLPGLGADGQGHVYSAFKHRAGEITDMLAPFADLEANSELPAEPGDNQ